MHARVVTFISHLGKMDEIIGEFHEQIIPTAQQQPGFAGGLLLTDRATGKVVVVSLWDTEAAMLRGEATGYQQAQRARIQRLAADTPTREQFEVSEAVPFSRHTSGDAVPASACVAPSGPPPSG
ncbi:MAG: hypothetical protein JO250_23845 [Armatimonadetes bacterium]|nr:hypothetical protein [Armatimonadota bacterium]